VAVQQAHAEGIPPELASEMCGVISKHCSIHQLFRNVWSSGRVPSEWKDDDVVLALHKGEATSDILHQFQAGQSARISWKGAFASPSWETLIISDGDRSTSIGGLCGRPHHSGRYSCF
jgi:hypothetical protein